MHGLVTAPGATLGSPFWEPVRALFDAVWPGMSARIDRAAALGARWEDVTTPFAWFLDGRAVAHVGVIEHPLLLDGQPRVVAGVHAVCTHPDHRRRGYALRLLRAATEWIDARLDTAKLHTDLPALYRRVGFRIAPLHRFRGAGRGGGGGARRLDPEDPADLERIRRALAERTPCSRRLCTRDPGWLPLIDACLARAEERLFHALPGGDWVGAWEVRGGVLRLHDLFGPRVPSAPEVLAAVAEPFDGVLWSFPPDLLDPSAEAEAVPSSEGTFLVRGTWDPSGPVGIPPTWEH